MRCCGLLLHSVAFFHKHTVALCRHAEFVKIMGPIEGLNAAVAQIEKQAFDQSEGNNVRTIGSSPGRMTLHLASFLIMHVLRSNLSRCLQQLFLSAVPDTNSHIDMQGM